MPSTNPHAHGVLTNSEYDKSVFRDKHIPHITCLYDEISDVFIGVVNVVSTEGIFDDVFIGGVINVVFTEGIFDDVFIGDIADDVVSE